MAVLDARMRACPGAGNRSERVQAQPVRTHGRENWFFLITELGNSLLSYLVMSGLQCFLFILKVKIPLL